MIAAATLLSCTSTKDNTLAYFKDLSAAPSGTLPNPQGNYPIRIQPDDELVITVTSSVPQATAAYNMPMDNPATRSSILTTTQPRTQTYIVDDDGYIMMPTLGRLHVGGMTISEIRNLVTSKVSEDVKDPFVRVDIVNFGIDVMGEVKNPHRGRQAQLPHTEPEQQRCVQFALLLHAPERCGLCRAQPDPHRQFKI